MNLMANNRDNTSTVYRKLTKEQLANLEDAIVLRDPPTFTACYEKFELRSLGISYDAFYRYARRIRSGLRAATFAKHSVTGTETPDMLLPQLVSQRMVEALLTDQATPQTLHRLADAYRMTAQVDLHRRRIDLTEEEKIHRVAAASHEDSRLPASRLNRPTDASEGSGAGR
ncbi:MAG: hypothetical protein AABZ08_07435 [Planctomycetota bacterium]